jgi:glycosyltransferase involved in cell wall biosynthesis
MPSIVFDVSWCVPYNRPVVMHILMIAPEPFFEPRGTPFSEFHRIRALLDLGHTVDLVTYPFGKDVTLPGLTIFRAARPPFVTRVKIGPSPAKLFLDLTLAVAALNQARRGRYDAVHSHEEGAAIGVLIAGLLGVPHLYDMHSSLPQQLENFAFSKSTLLRWMFSQLERTAIRRSRVTIVICPHLEEVAKRVVPDAHTILIENAPGSGDTPVAGTGRQIRATLGIGESAPMVLYTGTFEAYQGLELLFAAAAMVHRERPDVAFVLAGGKPDQVARAKAQAAELGAVGVMFTGERPSETIPSFLDAADVLVSPRSTGTNTPLKIYQYLRSGRAIVATRLLTHTQVLSDEVALLTEPTAEAFAQGVLRVVNDPALAARLGTAARQLADTRYTYDAYLQRTREACAALSAPLKRGRESFSQVT